MFTVLLLITDLLDNVNIKNKIIVKIPNPIVEKKICKILIILFSVPFIISLTIKMKIQILIIFLYL